MILSLVLITSSAGCLDSINVVSIREVPQSKAEYGYIIKNLTEEDFIKYPALRGMPRHITISDSAFASKPSVSTEEAKAILTEFSTRIKKYDENLGKERGYDGYVEYNGKYYSIRHLVSQ